MKSVFMAPDDIEIIDYDNKELTLKIKFPNNSVYKYRNIPLHVYRELVSTPTHTQFFNENIKYKGYRYRKIR